MSDSWFANRSLTVEFTFGATGEVLSLSGLRIHCEIASAGLGSSMKCSLRIAGMTLSDMNRLSMIGFAINVQSTDSVTVLASVGNAAAEIIFSGGLVEAWADFDGAPEVAFNVVSLAAAIAAAKPIAPSSFPKSANVADVLQTIAKKAKLGFVNHGVNKTFLGATYYASTAHDQIDQAARAAKVHWSIDRGTLHIWPEDAALTTTSTVTISSDTGLIGYPSYCISGVRFRCLFNNALSYFTTIKLVSKYAPAAWVDGSAHQGVRYPPSNGRWTIYLLQHTLDSQTPNGQWTSYIEAGREDLSREIVND